MPVVLGPQRRGGSIPEIAIQDDGSMLWESGNQTKRQRSGYSSTEGTTSDGLIQPLCGLLRNGRATHALADGVSSSQLEYVHICLRGVRSSIAASHRVSLGSRSGSLTTLSGAAESDGHHEHVLHQDDMLSHATSQSCDQRATMPTSAPSAHETAKIDDRKDTSPFTSLESGAMVKAEQQVQVAVGLPPATLAVEGAIHGMATGHTS